MITTIQAIWFIKLFTNSQKRNLDLNERKLIFSFMRITHN